MAKKYSITIEVEYKDAPKGTGDVLVKNVQRLSSELLNVPGASSAWADIEEWDVVVKKEKR